MNLFPPKLDLNKKIVPQNLDALHYRLKFHWESSSGMIYRLERVGGLHPSIYVYKAEIGHPCVLSRAPLGLHETGGKGTSEMEARISAAAEAVERLSMELQGDEEKVKSSYHEIRDRAILPNDYLLFSSEQYRAREKWNGSCSPRFRVPEPFDENAAIYWSPLWSLTQNQMRYFPTELCYFVPPHLHQPYFVSDSNGVAAGSSLEEAVFKGFLELVERDSVSIWWYNRLTVPALDWNGIRDPYLLEMKQYYENAGRQIWILDLTTDWNVPVHAAISAKTDGQNEMVMGFAADPDRARSRIKAMTELNQVYCASETGAYKKDKEICDWLKKASLKEYPQLHPIFFVAPKMENAEIESLADCLKLLERKKMEMLVLDLTREAMGLNVAKVFVPGMRHLRPRFAAGRLYDVPEKKLMEAKLNQQPIVF